MLEYIKWWYGAGWVGEARLWRKRLSDLAELFSVSMLLRTLFSPWKRIVTYPGAGLDEHLRAMLDNLISRVIGFGVRLFALLAALVCFIVFGIVAIVELVVWPLALPLIPVLLVNGVLG